MERIPEWPYAARKAKVQVRVQLTSCLNLKSTQKMYQNAAPRNSRTENGISFSIFNREAAPTTNLYDEGDAGARHFASLQLRTNPLWSKAKSLDHLHKLLAEQNLP